MDYAALKAADAALGIADIAQAAAALNAQTHAATVQDTPIMRMQSVLLATSTGEWARVVLRSRMTPTGAASDGAIIAAITATELVNAAAAGGITVVQTSVSSTAADLDASMAGLVAVGDISVASQTAIHAMRSGVPTPVWTVTAGDIQTARAQP